MRTQLYAYLELLKYTTFDVFMVLMIWIVVLWVMTPYGLEVVFSVSEETAVFIFIVTYILKLEITVWNHALFGIYLYPMLKITIIILFGDRVGYRPKAKK
jgi:hypothetical protein